MSPIAIVGAVLVAGVAIADLPARKPGNLTPIQMISALGAWALVLANASAIGIGIRDRSLVLLCSGTATVAITLTLMIRQNGARLSGRDAPQALQLVIDDLKQLLGGAPRLGMASLDAMVVDGRCPGIGVAVAKQGRVIVRVRRDVAEWLEGHRQAGGARAELVASFARFVVLHELAHVLNGDHRTFRFVRSVLVAHLVWLAGAAGAAVSLASRHRASARPLLVATSILTLFIAQCLVARRFIAERERLADWRAVQTLSPADAGRLTERRGRRRGLPNPTELEKLMTDLKLHGAARHGGGLLSRLIVLVWPEGDDIHARSAQVEAGRGGGAPRPLLWAALVGMQCGFLSMSLALAVMLAIQPWLYLWPGASAMVMIAVLIWVSAPGAMFCGLRVDPTRINVRMLTLTGTRVRGGVVFYLAFATSALTLTGFHTRFGIAFRPEGVVVGILFLVAMTVSLCTWLSTLFGIRDGGGELRMTPRSLWVVVFPSLAVIALLQVPLSVIASRLIGGGSFLTGRWVPVVVVSLAISAVSSAMGRSTSPAVRAIAPLAVLDRSDPVYGFRVLWRNFYIDVSRTTLARGAVAAMMLQLVAIPFSILGAGLLMPRIERLLAGQPMSAIAVLAGSGVMALLFAIPDRDRAYSGPSARLLDTDRLQLFERLLEAARSASPPSADRLTDALACWLRNGHFPDALLPEPATVWPLEPLLSMVRLARATGETAVLERWRGRIEHAVRQIVSNDAVAVAPRQPPCLYWTVVAATVVDEAELRDAFPFERMLDRIETLLDERLDHGTVNLVTDVVAAWRLLRRLGRPGPDPQRVRRFIRSSSLASRPLLRQSLAELVEVAELTNDDELRERLGPIVRSRMWEVLQLNPRKDTLLLLDCYLAAAGLRGLDARNRAAGVIVAELAARVADELMAVATDTSRAVNTPRHRRKA